MRQDKSTGHRWSTAELADLMRMWSRGDEVADIATHFGMTQRSVCKLVTRLRRAGVPLANRKRGHRAGRHNKPWSQSEVEYVIRRREDKTTAEQIAAELDRTYCGVNALISRLRLDHGVPVSMLGHGTRKLWDPTVLSALAVALDPEPKIAPSPLVGNIRRIGATNGRDE